MQSKFSQGHNVLFYDIFSLHGIPRNPYNLACYPGGSSSGSGSAVAAGNCDSLIFLVLIIQTLRCHLRGTRRAFALSRKAPEVSRNSVKSQMRHQVFRSTKFVFTIFELLRHRGPISTSPQQLLIYNACAIRDQLS